MEKKGVRGGEKKKSTYPGRSEGGTKLHPWEWNTRGGVHIYEGQREDAVSQRSLAEAGKKTPSASKRTMVIKMSPFQLKKTKGLILTGGESKREDSVRKQFAARRKVGEGQGRAQETIEKGGGEWFLQSTWEKQNTRGRRKEPIPLCLLPAASKGNGKKRCPNGLRPEGKGEEVVIHVLLPMERVWEKALLLP